MPEGALEGIAEIPIGAVGTIGDRGALEGVAELLIGAGGFITSPPIPRVPEELQDLWYYGATQVRAMSGTSRLTIGARGTLT